jgi:hypothetical protein
MAQRRAEQLHEIRHVAAGQLAEQQRLDMSPS